MKKQFIVDNKIVTPIDIPDGLLRNKIPLKIYAVKESQIGFYLEETKEKFDIPDKLYGSIKSRVDKIKITYESRNTSLGVLLTGLKGAGKSLLIKEIANTMLKDMPVILIQDKFIGTQFMTFIESLGECVIIFDEFGKTYKRSNSEDTNDQHELLTFFDGVYSSKRLILLAENKEWDVDDLFLNRPSRILYHWKFDRLEEEVILGYCEDTLDKQEFIKDIQKIYNNSRDFTFDSLQAIVTQCNIFKDCAFEEIIDGLNIPRKSDVEFIPISLEYENKNLSDNILQINNDNGSIYCKFKVHDENNNYIDTSYFDEKDFVSKIGDIITYKNDKYTLRYRTQTLFNLLF